MELSDDTLYDDRRCHRFIHVYNFSKKTRSFQNCLVFLGYTMIKVIFISLNSYTAMFALEVHLDGYMRAYFENEIVINHYIHSRKSSQTFRLSIITTLLVVLVKTSQNSTCR